MRSAAFVEAIGVAIDGDCGARRRRSRPRVTVACIPQPRLVKSPDAPHAPTTGNPTPDNPDMSVSDPVAGGSLPR